MKNLSAATALLLLFSLLLSSCKEKEPITDIEARNYISAYTQGMISESDPIEFRLLRSGVLDSAVIHQAISTEPVFDFSIAINEDKAGFKVLPVKKLTRGAEYKIKVRLDKVLNLPEIYNASQQSQNFSTICFRTERRANY